jgi:hypothetical protein
MNIKVKFFNASDFATVEIGGREFEVEVALAKALEKELDNE